MSRRTHVLGVTMLAASIAAVAVAGTSYNVICRNEKCGFKGSVDFGGGFRFEQITGYCARCQKFVCLRWPREGMSADDLKPKAKPAGLIWDSATGQTKELYACPYCNNSFLPILSEKELRFCPKCGRESLKLGVRLLYD